MKTENISETAAYNLNHGYNCAEAIVGAFNEHYPDNNIDLSLATPFGAGLGGRRDLCGILIGGTMIIGKHFGRTDPADLEQKALAYKLAGAYYRWFKQQFGAVMCRNIVTGKFTGHTDVCVNIIEQAADYLAGIIDNSEL